MMRLYIIISFILIALVSQAQVPVRYQSQVEKTFGAAVRSFESGNYRNAYTLFDSLIRIKSVHQRTTASFLMAAKCLQRMKSYRSSAMLLKDFLNRFPMSSYASDAYYSLAVSSILNQEHRQAGIHLLNSLDLARGEVTRSRSVELFSALAEYRYNLSDLRELVQIPDSLIGKDLVRLKLAEEYAREGKTEESRDIITAVLSRTRVSVFQNLYEELYENLKTVKPDVIGVVLPASENANPPSVRLLASEIAEGMLYANEEYRSGFGMPDGWSLDIRKVGNRIEESVDAVRSLARDPKVGVIVGPLFPGAVAECARIAADANVPLIVPTSVVPGNVGRDVVFQIVPGNAMCGKLLARYAVEQEKMSTFAILSSDEENARIYAESFSSEAKRLGAKILVHEQYESGVSDLRDQYMNIRKAGFGRLSQLELADNTEHPMNKIDAILLSIGKREEIGVIASQLSYYNIRTAILGNGVWDDRVQLQKNRSYIDGIIFGTDELYDESSDEVYDFKQNYYKRIKKYPSSYSALGYDIMMLIMNLTDGEARSRGRLAEELLQLRDYRGIRSVITFSGGGVNSDMFIIEFRDGELRKITEVSLK